jgi:hypothetical protein
VGCWVHWREAGWHLRQEETCCATDPAYCPQVRVCTAHRYACVYWQQYRTVAQVLLQHTLTFGPPPSPFPSVTCVTFSHLCDLQSHV